MTAYLLSASFWDDMQFASTVGLVFILMQFTMFVTVFSQSSKHSIRDTSASATLAVAAMLSDPSIYEAPLVDKAVFLKALPKLCKMKEDVVAAVGGGKDLVKKKKAFREHATKLLSQF